MEKSAYFILGVLMMTTIGIACNKSDENEPAVILTEEEKNDLFHLREEEKLARDVYLYAFEVYGLSISKNISSSEQAHMDKVLQILQYYDLEDPASEEAGVFENLELQSLYTQFVAEVDQSEHKALIVGATIEDLDIKDIEEFLQRTEKEDVSSMYQSFMCGSRNHLRSYNAQIVLAGDSYSPQYISQTEFESIVQSESEKCGQ